MLVPAGQYAEALELVAAGGPERPDGLDTGYYVRPTVLGDVVPGSRVEQEEVFGPVLAVIPYDPEDEAVASERHAVRAVRWRVRR